MSCNLIAFYAKLWFKTKQKDLSPPPTHPPPPPKKPQTPPGK